jgi:hypothetical protein
VEKKVEAPPSPPPQASTFPPPSGKAIAGKTPPTIEKMVDLTVGSNNLHVEMRNRGIREGILGIPTRTPKFSASHSTPTTPNFHTDPVFGKYLSSQESAQPMSTYPPHKHLPKLDFPKFNGDNPRILAMRCEVYFNVFSVPESLHTRYATLNFSGRAALWLEMIEVSGRIEEWATLCHLVFQWWDRDQHHTFMRQILALQQTGSVAEYIEKFEDLRHQVLLHDPSPSSVFFVAHFLDGLRDDIRSVLSIHHPQDMETICALVLMQEEEVEGSKRKPVFKEDHQSTRFSWKASDKPKEHRKTEDIDQKSDDKLTSLLAYRRAKGMCCKCGDKWGKGYTCPAQVPLHIVEEVLSVVLQSGSAVPMQTEEYDSDEGLKLLAVQKEHNQSATAVKKLTMRLLRWVGKQRALILVDSGSAATFISTTFADKCGLHMDQSECS